MVPLPCVEAREAMLRKHLQERVAQGVNLSEVCTVEILQNELTDMHTLFSFYGIREWIDRSGNGRLQWSRY